MHCQIGGHPPAIAWSCAPPVARFFLFFASHALRWFDGHTLDNVRRSRVQDPGVALQLFVYRHLPIPPAGNGKRFFARATIRSQRSAILKSYIAWGQ